MQVKLDVYILIISGIIFPLECEKMGMAGLLIFFGQETVIHLLEIQVITAMRCNRNIVGSSKNFSVISSEKNNFFLIVANV